MFNSFEPSKSSIAVILIKEFTECLDSCNTNASRPTWYPTEGEFKVYYKLRKLYLLFELSKVDYLRLVKTSHLSE